MDKDNVSMEREEGGREGGREGGETTLLGGSTLIMTFSERAKEQMIIMSGSLRRRLVGSYLISGRD